ncbi:MAG: hypothetical protein GC164_15925 [Phycisphaera sp.]|nr:hypothetical protein [Phycisphaera sp.]
MSVRDSGQFGVERRGVKIACQPEGHDKPSSPMRSRANDAVHQKIRRTQDGQRPSLPSRRPALGLSLVETLIALAITAMLLTATMVAIDASFKAYASAAEQASSQSGLRMIANRLLTLVRTSTAHGPLQAETNVTLDGNLLTSYYIELLDPNNNVVKVEYKAEEKQLWLTTTPAAGGASNSQPLLDGVTDAKFFCLRRKNAQGLYVLERGTIDITVQPGADATLQIESGSSPAIRLIASTMPRKLN